MEIHLLSVGEQALQLNIALRARICAVFSRFTQKPCSMEPYPDFKKLLIPLSKALAAGQMTVIFAGEDCFNEVKRSLLRALHLRCELSLDIIEKLPQQMSAVEKELQGMFPVNAEIFPSADGLYSAFCSCSGAQTLLFCSLIGNYMKVLEEDIADYISRHFALPSSDAEGYVKMFRGAAQELYERNLTAAVACTQTADFIRSPAAISGRLAQSFKFAQTAVPACIGEPQDHIARAAADAAAECNTLLGIAMSNIFLSKRHDRQQYVVYIAVSHENSVTVSRVYSGSLEIKPFLKKAACELFSLLSCVIESQYDKTEIDDFDVF